MNLCWLLAGMSALAAPAFAQTVIAADPDYPCEGVCARAIEPHAPFHIHGDTWFVGTAGLTSLLIVSDEGHILADTGYPAAAPQIAENIAALGFDVADIRLILSTHSHGDHAGALAAFQAASGAPVAASPKTAGALEGGRPIPEDLYYHERPGPDYPPVANLQHVADGETLRVGPHAVTAIYTPGHTPGGTTWTWRSCEGDSCVNIVHADSVSPIAPAGWRFTDNPDHAETYRNSMARIAALPCDIVTTTHTEMSGMMDKAARIGQSADNPFIDPLGCARYALRYAEALGRILIQEAAAE